MINTGTLDMDWSQPVSNKLRNLGQSSSDFDSCEPVSSRLTGNGQSSSDFDWSQPVTSNLTGNGQSSSDFDWSQPVSSKLTGNGQSSSDFDWSQPVSSKLTGNGQSSLDFDWSQSVSSNLSSNDGINSGTSSRIEYNSHNLARDGNLDSSKERNDLNATENHQKIVKELHLNENKRPNEDFTSYSTEPQNNDAISQRLKFRACLKLVVEELCTLPHHCEIHNKDLRSTFTAWLKKELDLIHRICDFKRNGSQSDSLLPLRVSTPTAVETGNVSFKPAVYSPVLVAQETK